LRRHAELVEAAAGRVRVSSVPPEDVVRRQYAESLEVWRIVIERDGVPATLTDVGSGGGFPGLVIAVISPETAVHLVEPLHKRANLLTGLAAELGLANVTVHAVRAEEAGRGPLRDAADVVTARAVAGLRELAEYTAPLVRPAGLVALPKGSAFAEELATAEVALRSLRCELVAFEPMRPEVSTTLGVALLRKLAPTPDAYPRRAGLPAKRPL
jgi:16S rRNA (guanine527-N7)-methyltransferase